MVVDKLHDMVHNLVVGGLAGHSGFGVYERNAAVHLDELTIIVSFGNVGFGPLPCKVDAVSLVGLGLLRAVDGAIRVVNRAGVPVQRQEVFSVLGVIQEEVRRAYALVVVYVLVGERVQIGRKKAPVEGLGFGGGGGLFGFVGGAGKEVPVYHVEAVAHGGVVRVGKACERAGTRLEPVHGVKDIRAGVEELGAGREHECCRRCNDYSVYPTCAHTLRNLFEVQGLPPLKRDIRNWPFPGPSCIWPGECSA